MAQKCQCSRIAEQGSLPTDGSAAVEQAIEPTLHEDETGATALETVLLLGAIAIPSYFVLTICLNILTDHYAMLVTIHSLPFP